MKSNNKFSQNKFLKLISINAVIVIIIFIILFTTFLNNEIVNFGIDFESLYSEVEKLSYEDPKKINTTFEGISFYRPSGYTTTFDDGIFLESIYSYLNIIPNRISADNINNKYKINPDEKIIYEKTNSNNSNDKFTNMLVWKIDNDMYEILLLNENNDAIVGDIKSKYIYQGVTDMAYILNSIKAN